MDAIIIQGSSEYEKLLESTNRSIIAGEYRASDGENDLKRAIWDEIQKTMPRGISEIDKKYANHESFLIQAQNRMNMMEEAILPVSEQKDITPPTEEIRSDSEHPVSASPTENTPETIAKHASSSALRKPETPRKPTFSEIARLKGIEAVNTGQMTIRGSADIEPALSNFVGYIPLEKRKLSKKNTPPET